MTQEVHLASIASAPENERPEKPAASPFDRFKRVGTAMAVLVILVAIAEFCGNASNPTDRDFISFWGAAQLALSGDPAAAYDQARLHEVQSAVVRFVNGDGMPFPYTTAFRPTAR